MSELLGASAHHKWQDSLQKKGGEKTQEEKQGEKLRIITLPFEQ